MPRKPRRTGEDNGLPPEVNALSDLCPAKYTLRDWIIDGNQGSDENSANEAQRFTALVSVCTPAPSQFTVAAEQVADLARETRDSERRSMLQRLSIALSAGAMAPQQVKAMVDTIQRAWKSKGGPAAAEKRHRKHFETKVKPYREEYRMLLAAERREYPRESPRALSAKIIRRMAKAHGEQVKRMRDIVRPLEMLKYVH